MVTVFELWMLYFDVLHDAVTEEEDYRGVVEIVDVAGCSECDVKNVLAVVVH